MQGPRTALGAAMLAAGVAGAIITVGSIPAFTAPASPATPYRPPVFFTGDAARFALVVSVTVDGRRELYTVDRDLTRDDCEAVAGGFPGAALSDIGVRIAVETAGDFSGWRVACIEERET